MNRLKHAMVLLALAGTIGSQPVFADEALQAAINGSQRSEANKARDAARHPQQTLEFFGITPSMTVVELNPGGGWYTEILAPYLRAKGHLIEAFPEPKSKDQEGRAEAAAIQKKMNASPAVYDKVKTATFEPPEKLSFAPNNSADLVLTFRNVHNWVGYGDEKMQTMFKAVFSSLKKGGVFGVVDHRLPAGKTQDKDASTGYVSEAYVIKIAESAGFKLAAKSEINANPKDNADHKNGVWALPPTFANKDEDRKMYADIGESDRLTLKFVKP
ncbi:putative methyltransferase [Oxalobacteraceae bacterium GrIS 1.18]